MKYIIILILTLSNCNKKTILPNDVEIYQITKYSYSNQIKTITNKLINIDWNVINLERRRESIYLLLESIKLKQHKLCSENPYSEIVIGDENDIFKMINKIEYYNQDSKDVYFYTFLNISERDEILVEIRNRDKAKYTILCGVAVD